MCHFFTITVPPEAKITIIDIDFSGGLGAEGRGQLILTKTGCTSTAIVESTHDKGRVGVSASWSGNVIELYGDARGFPSINVNTTAYFYR